MAAGEFIVRVRLWRSPDDPIDEYYAVPEGILPAIRAGVRGGEHPSARRIIERDGRKLTPVETVEVNLY